MDEEIKDILKKSGDLDLGVSVMELTLSLLEKEKIETSRHQQVGIASHLSAMVHRSLTGEELPHFETELFSEISAHSIGLAAEVCGFLQNLSESEKYLLSIHFETAKQIA